MPRQKKNSPNIVDLIGEVFDQKFDQKIEEKQLVTRKDLKYLPTKDEFYKGMDSIMGELKTVREELTIISGLKRQVNNHEERLETIEGKLDIQPNLA